MNLQLCSGVVHLPVYHTYCQNSCKHNHGDMIEREIKIEYNNKKHLQNANTSTSVTFDIIQNIRAIVDRPPSIDRVPDGSEVWML